MGSQCSVRLAEPLAGLGCGPQDLDCEDDECGCAALRGPRPPGAAPGGAQPHPLLGPEERTEGPTPRTPRGPAPPWAVSSLAPPVDRTATGATPPRSPTPPRLTPPGLPEEDARAAAGAATLGAALDARFAQELFAAARGGGAEALAALLQRAGAQALALAAEAAPPRRREAEDEDAAEGERAERAAELLAAYLAGARGAAAAGAPRETLLGAAAALGRAEAVRLLLAARAEPLARDDRGCGALHRAAEGGSLLTVLLVLDRLQAGNRSLALAELTNVDGETPEMFAALAGASEICRAFEVFSDMQNDAELRQLGSNFSPPELSGGQRGVGTGDVLTFIDLAAEARSGPGIAASALLRRCTMGCSLVPSPTRRIPEDETAMRQVIDNACHGIATAEEVLLTSVWNPSDPGLDPALRGLVTAAELRSSWQRLRAGTLKTADAQGADEFWQTHLTAEMMISTLQSAVGDTFQLLLTVLWLYTREAWLRHILDAIAAAAHAAMMLQGDGASGSSSSAEGAGSTTPFLRTELPMTLQPVAPLIEALAPCMQLVQSALSWFEEAGIRHSAVTYRPLSLPMLGLQRLVDRYVAQRRSSEVAQEKASSSNDRGEPHGSTGLGTGTWVALGAGSFFSSMSSRSEAIKRLLRTRCNTLLVIKPDEVCPCYPKHMSLRGSSVDDTIFPFHALFRITRITRSVSSDLDPEIGGRGASSRWPVMIVEASAGCRQLEALELLELRGGLGAGDLEACLRRWLADAPPDEEHERLLAAGEFLARRPGRGASGGRAELAAQLLGRYADYAEGSGDAAGAARALLARARCGGAADGTVDGKRALGLLAERHGAEHPETEAARAAWRELGALV